MTLCGISSAGSSIVVVNAAATVAASGVRSHVGRQGGGARVVVGRLGIRRGARSLSTAPRCVATNLRPDLNFKRPTTTTAFSAPTTTTTLAVTEHLSTVRSKLHTPPSHTRRKYATMASATSFFDFKPKDSMFALSCCSSFVPSLHRLGERKRKRVSLLYRILISNTPLPLSLRSLPFVPDVIPPPLPPSLLSYPPRCFPPANSRPQRRANPMTSPNSREKSSSSSTRPQNAASPRNSKGSRNSTRS